MNLQMDQLDDPLTTRPIQMGSEFPLNHTRIDGSGLLTPWTSDLAPVQSDPDPDPKPRSGTVVNTKHI
jgi:hypothetical protein